MQVFYTTRFKRKFRKLPADIQKTAVKREVVFRKNPFDKILRTHKLTGELAGYWSFSIDYSYRIIFRFEGDDVVFFITAGDYSIYE